VRRQIAIEAKKKIMTAMEAIEEVTLLFYQQKTKEGYNKLEAVLTDISGVIELLYALKKEELYRTNEMLEILRAAMAALEKKDLILLSDILNYELKDRFERILEII
jgi:hypothetical protein